MAYPQGQPTAWCTSSPDSRFGKSVRVPGKSIRLESLDDGGDPGSPSAHADTRHVPGELALAAFYEQHRAELTSYLRKQFGNGPPDPNDMTQLAFQKLLERGDLSGIRCLRAFLWRTARNLTLNYRRSDSIRCGYDFEIEQLFFAEKGNGSSPERVVEVREQLRIVSEALRGMPEKRRVAFVLHRIEGYTISAIARQFGLSRAAILKHVARAASEIDTALERETGPAS